MSSQISLTTRRKFLQRSVLGAGSVLFAPILLESCTDHRIPSPNNDKPPLTDLGVDWNDDAKILITSVIEMIPEAGDILGGLVDIFWPSSNEDVWGQIKAQVEALVDQKIADNVYHQVSEDLTGLKNSITLYLNGIQNGTDAEKLDQWIVTRNLFVLYLPHFQSVGYELPLLPLFGQFANLYLALLRDGVAFGTSWGRTDKDQQQTLTDLKDNINGFYAYTAKTYNDGRANLYKTTKADFHACEPFRTINKYDRQLTLTVLDFMYSWYYYDVSIYPNGTTPVIKREVYSDPMGTCDDSGNIFIAPPGATQRPTTVTIWDGDRINAVQVTYPAGGGNGGITQTKRMGAAGGTNSTFTITPDNPIIGARATYGSIVNSMQFVFNDGTLTDMLGGNAGLGSNDSGMLGFPYEALSSILINGESSFYESADCVVFGFQYWKSPAAMLKAICAIYVKSPKERSAVDFVKAFPKVVIPADLITDELKAARKAHWEAITARAKALK